VSAAADTTIIEINFSANPTVASEMLKALREVERINSKAGEVYWH
jgi:hypothetical protein